MDILQLKYFSAVAQFEHVTKASEYLHVAQPTVSQMISRLEKELGVELFDRQGKSIRLNMYGKSLLTHTEKALAILSAAMQEIDDMKKAVDQTIIVGGWAGSGTLAGMLSVFSEKYPHVKIKFVQSNRVEECDVRFFYSAFNAPSQPHSELLVQEELLLAIPNGNALSLHDSLPLSAVKDEAFIGPHDGKPLCEIISAYCKLAGFAPHIVLEYDDMVTLRHMLQLGLGIAFVPEKTWGRLKPEMFKLVHVEFPRCLRSLYMSRRDDLEPSYAAQLLISFAREYFEPINRAMAPDDRKK